MTYPENTAVVEVRVPATAVVEIASERYPGQANVIDAATRGPRGVQGHEGPVGPVGPRGPEGPQGPQGEMLLYEQHFASPDLVWFIPHGLNTYPTVQLFDLYDTEISGTISTPDRNTVVVAFGVPFAGTARLRA